VGYNVTAAVGFHTLWDSKEEVFLRCGIQQKRLSFIVGYDGGGFPPLWNTPEEVFLHCGILQ
jgi:hypothetical protein